MKKYFIIIGSEQQGPFDIDELKDKNLKNDTPVWYDGLSDWITIGEVDELRNVFAKTPPPYKPVYNDAQPPKYNMKSKIESDPIYGQKKKSSVWKWILIIFCTIVVAFVCLYILKEIAHKNEQNNTRNNINLYVTASTNNYTYYKVGGISNLEITVWNSTDYMIDEAKIAIIYIKDNGDVWDTKYEVFSMIAPHDSKTHSIPDTNRGVKVETEVVEVTSSSLGLY